MTYIIVDKENNVKLLAFSREVIKERGIEMTIKSQGKEGLRVFEYEKTLPPEPTEAWVWNEEEHVIEYDETRIPIHWGTLGQLLEQLPTRVIMAMGINYFRMREACKIESSSLLGQAYLSLQGLDPGDMGIIGETLEICYVPDSVYAKEPF